MNIFRLNQWVILVFFTLPCLVFSENLAVLSVYTFLFFSLYLLVLLKSNKAIYAAILLRNKFECAGIALAYLGFIFYSFEEGFPTFNEEVNFALSVFYFVLLADLTIGFKRFFIPVDSSFSSIGYVLLIFFSFLVPPIGIFYLKRIYSTAFK